MLGSGQILVYDLYICDAMRNLSSMANTDLRQLKTSITQIDPAALFALRSLVYRVLRHLEWRHSGLGMLQAYITEGGQDELRVHVWHPELKVKGIDGAGLDHDHRFDMMSWMLIGQLMHSELIISQKSDRWFNMYEVVNARRALRETGTRAGEFRFVEGPVQVEKHVMTISAGNSYFFPKRTFHETRLDSRIAISIALKSNQEEAPARVLCDLHKEPLNAFGTSLPEVKLNLALAEAESALKQAIDPNYSSA